MVWAQGRQRHHLVGVGQSITVKLPLHWADKPLSQLRCYDARSQLLPPRSRRVGTNLAGMTSVFAPMAL